jgi:XTP/dITP diphosphohydrolase
MSIGEIRVHTLVLATANPGKVIEFERLLAEAGIPLHVLGLDAVGLSAPPETGETFAENAILKARHAAEGSGLPALADDSGLAVDGLGGAPGVRSARYAGEESDDEANRQRLVAELARVPEAARTARFHCAIAIALPDGTIETVEETFEGSVITEARGTGGFGYDALFLIPGRGLTLAELTLEEKNRISHRARATAQAVPVLRQLLGGMAQKKGAGEG